MNSLLSEGKLIARFIKEIFPLVHHALSRWEEYGAKIPDPVLKTQALASLKNKKFHCQGGSIYALYPKADQARMVSFIVAFQTISDYLDNLCDRTGCEDERSFRQLHLAMKEALEPDLPLSDYYLYYPYQSDGGYLKALVQECRRCLTFFPSYGLAAKEVQFLVSLYTDLQSLKHLGRDIREERLKQWAGPYLKDYPQLSPWEFSAATGSTLGVFMLVAWASQEQRETKEIGEIITVYFPFISALHILLDYFIDQREDLVEGDLNFVSYYEGAEETAERLCYFLKESLVRTSRMRYPIFQDTVVKGLLALYLSDQKVNHPVHQGIAKKLLAQGGWSCQTWYHLCKQLRRYKMI
ncbi:tetraprenyl-beta-curcumene synthase family protein [Dehalobacterium formicoaceticum]|uniref:Tetraprenyl-beta-curcumene synthase family protein n=1 Tax=Dehalobacterium formicoaceticum TaxID=51515 RepID=A0ABT1Y3L1_9FIRM|nr:tetraprenyl-beta-curcumene synthase family protein [Dehalobacterium formicoaceticum]MCR6545464.1 tetraprenyl-beta-curcumene synthase family protein [Dehalobacterium formicoaceticum]